MVKQKYIWIAHVSADNPTQAKTHFKNRAKYNYRYRGEIGSKIVKVVKQSRGDYKIEFTLPKRKRAIHIHRSLFKSMW